MLVALKHDEDGTPNHRLISELEPVFKHVHKGPITTYMRLSLDQQPGVLCRIFIRFTEEVVLYDEFVKVFSDPVAEVRRKFRFEREVKQTDRPVWVAIEVAHEVV